MQIKDFIKITIVLYVHDSSLGANWTTIFSEEFAVGIENYLFFRIKDVVCKQQHAFVSLLFEGSDFST